MVVGGWVGVFGGSLSVDSGSVSVFHVLTLFLLK